MTAPKPDAHKRHLRDVVAWRELGDTLTPAELRSALTAARARLRHRAIVVRQVRQ